jgi:hypothetical protein
MGAGRMAKKPKKLLSQKSERRTRNLFIKFY